MKAIKIDVDERDVYEVELDGSLESYYKQIGCSIVEKRTIDDSHDLVFDEEGDFKLEDEGFARGFQLSALGFPIIGNALIVSYDQRGNWKSHQTNVNDIKNRVLFGGWFLRDKQPV
jgi:hypothetical protein